MFYKFIELNDTLDSLDDIDKILVNPTIKLSSIKYLNDPNEMKFTYRLPKKYKSDIKKEWLSSHPKRTEDDFNKWFSSFDDDKLHSMRVKFCLYERQLFKIASLSTCCTSNLLWSHYAGGKNGFCVIYNESILNNFKNKFDWLSGPVIYKNKPPVINIFKDLQMEAMKKMCFIKEKCWEYEKEYRIAVIDASEKPVFIEIQNEDIFGVILGINTAETLRQIIANICKEKKYKLFEVCNYHSTYKLHAIEIKNTDERLMIAKF